MRIVARRAGRFLIHNVVTMATILELAVNRFEALVAEETVTVMAFVTQRVSAQILGRAVAED